MSTMSRPPMNSATAEPGPAVASAAWRGNRQVDTQSAVLGRGTVRLRPRRGRRARRGLLPARGHEAACSEASRPSEATSRRRPGGRGGLRTVTPSPKAGPPGSPSRCWLAIAGRERAMDTVNLGFAGSARGEIVLAQQIATLDADVITVAFGTNCWTTQSRTRRRWCGRTLRRSCGSFDPHISRFRCSSSVP